MPSASCGRSVWRLSIAKSPNLQKTLDFPAGSQYSRRDNEWFNCLHLGVLLHLSRHRDLALENLALRQQLAIFKLRHPRPRLRPTDRILWVWLSNIWVGWRETLIIVKPETVIAWHRQTFRFYWRWFQNAKHAKEAKHTKSLKSFACFVSPACFAFSLLPVPV